MCANPRMTDELSITETNVNAGQPEPRAWHHRNLCWRVIHVLFFLFCRSWIRLRASGQENIDNTRGGLFLINHQSFLDPLLVAVLLSRPVSFLARDSLFKVPFIGWVLRSTYVIPISREAARGGSIRVAMERLDAGFLVGIFPEGTRSLTEEVKSFRPGFWPWPVEVVSPSIPLASPARIERCQKARGGFVRFASRSFMARR